MKHEQPSKWGNTNNLLNTWVPTYLENEKDWTAIDLATVVEFQDKVHNLFTKESISKNLLKIFLAKFYLNLLSNGQ